MADNNQKYKDIVLNEIEKERFFKFENKPDIIFDKKTGLLWSTFPKFKIRKYLYQEAKQEIDSFDFGFDGFRIPSLQEINEISKANILNITSNTTIITSNMGCRVLSEFFKGDMTEYHHGDCFPCSSILEKEYVHESVSSLLKMLLKYNLKPVFSSEEAKQSYENLLDPESEQKCVPQKVEGQPKINYSINTSDLCSKFDITHVDDDPLCFCKALCKWIDILNNEITVFKSENRELIEKSSYIEKICSDTTVDEKNFSEEEKNFFNERNRRFKERLKLNFDSVSLKLLTFRRQAESIISRINEAICSGEPIFELARISKEDFPKFSFVMNVTSNLVEELNIKVVRIGEKADFLKLAYQIMRNWYTDYVELKKNKYNEFRKKCESERVDHEKEESFFSEWTHQRFSMEKQLQQIIERLDDNNIVSESGNIDISGEIIKILEELRNKTDRFFLNERIPIHQEYAYEKDGEIQEKIEISKRLFEIANDFRDSLCEVIFDCKNIDDRSFLFNWASVLLDLPLDSLSDMDSFEYKVSSELLEELVKLKQKNYQIFLSDAKEFSERQAERDKHYRSLLFKMRKEIEE